MNRRSFLRGSAAALAAGKVLLAQSSSTARAAPATVPASRPALSPPMLLNPSAAEVTVVCAVPGLCTGWVEYGIDQQLGQRADGAVHGLKPLSDRILRLPITGLTPGTRYWYRVCAMPVDASTGRRGSLLLSEISSFRTLDPAADRGAFAVWNDTHEQKPTLEKLSAMLQADPVDFVVWNGDITNDIHSEAKIPAQFISPFGIPLADSVPMFYARGNHDTRGRDARRLPEYICGPQGRYHYAFRHGPVAALVLDTGEDKPDNHPSYRGLADFAALRTEQRRWLRQAIDDPAFRSAPFRVAFMHIPLVWEAPIPENWPKVWGSGIKGWICEDGLAKWHDLLVEAKVHVVISGHTHRPAWFAPKPGRPWGQLIGGGPKPDEATAIVVRADRNRMEFTVRNLKGEAVISQEITAG